MRRLCSHKSAGVLLGVRSGVEVVSDVARDSAAQGFESDHDLTTWMEPADCCHIFGAHMVENVVAKGLLR